MLRGPHPLAVALACQPASLASQRLAAAAAAGDAAVAQGLAASDASRLAGACRATLDSVRSSRTAIPQQSALAGGGTAGQPTAAAAAAAAGHDALLPSAAAVAEGVKGKIQRLQQQVGGRPAALHFAWACCLLSFLLRGSCEVLDACWWKAEERLPNDRHWIAPIFFLRVQVAQKEQELAALAAEAQRAQRAHEEALRAALAQHQAGRLERRRLFCLQLHTAGLPGGSDQTSAWPSSELLPRFEREGGRQRACACNLDGARIPLPALMIAQAQLAVQRSEHEATVGRNLKFIDQVGKWGAP